MCFSRTYNLKTQVTTMLYIRTTIYYASTSTILRGARQDCVIGLGCECAPYHNIPFQSCFISFLFPGFYFDSTVYTFINCLKSQASTRTP